MRLASSRRRPAPVPTIHRLLRSLPTTATSARASRRYALGARSRLGSRRALLVPGRSRGWPSWSGDRRDRDLPARGGCVVYVAQCPRPLDADVHRGRPAGLGAQHGRRQGSAVPDADDEVLELLRAPVCRRSSPARTPTHRLLAELAEVREQGWAVDDAEQEGVRCGPSRSWRAPTVGAVGSGPSAPSRRGGSRDRAPAAPVAVGLSRDLRGATPPDPRPARPCDA